MAEQVIGYLTVDDRAGSEVEPSALFRRYLALAGEVSPNVHVRATTDPDVPSHWRFTRLVEDLMPPTVPSPAWVLQARRNAAARHELLDEFGALASAEVADLVGSRAGNRRAAASRLQANGALFSVDHHGQTLFPGFQFDSDTGQPKPAVAAVLAALPEQLRTGGWQLALWWSTPTAWLDWARPVDVLDKDAEHVVAAARHEAEDWADAAVATRD